MDDITKNIESEEYRKLLGIGALFKEVFSIDCIIDLIPEKRPSVILALFSKAVSEKHLVTTTPGFYTFTDEKIRKKFRSYLSSQEKQYLHEQIADFLMRELADDGEKVHAVAHHLIHISNDLKKCLCLTEAGDLYLCSHETEKALQCYRKVLDDLFSFHGEEEDRLFAETTIKYSKISAARDNTTKVLEILESARERANKWGLDDLESLLEMHIAKNHWLSSHYDSALRYFQKGWTSARRLNTPKILKSATVFSTFFHFWQGHFLEAVSIYETSVPDIQRYPKGEFPLLAIMTVGYCYAQIGQISQGLGMLDSIYSSCLEKGDHYLLSYILGNIGNILLQMEQVDDAIKYLENASVEANKQHNNWVWITTQISLAYAYYLKGKKNKALTCLRSFLKQSNEVKATVYLYPYLLELCYAMETGKLQYIQDLSFEKEIQKAMKSKNIFLKGVAYRLHSLVLVSEKVGEKPREHIIRSLKYSIKYLEESGNQIELAKSQLALARQYLSYGKEEKAHLMILNASKILSSINDSLIPDDLRAIVKGRLIERDLLKEILNLSQEIVTIRNSKDLVQNIISTVNRITGAERGAIFLLKKKEFSQEMVLRASKNLTLNHINSEAFQFSMKLIHKVAREGKGEIAGDRSRDTPTLGNDTIHSRICVPMILRGKTVGVLYHDNRLLRNAFKESDLELLSYFAAQAAFALDNAEAYDKIKALNQQLGEENMYYKKEHLKNLYFQDIIGESTAIKNMLNQIDKVVDTDVTVMITGETGVGKELVAKAIHNRHSKRKDGPFIRVHCSALPQTLIPSELFGHEKGAFTGAISKKIGRFELANTGTLFLDEIGEINEDIQIKLLRVIQTREFERVGGTRTIKSDFRLVVATNRDLKKEVAEQNFRADLYYRLAIFPIHVPPLRDRKEDIPLLAYHFLNIYSMKTGKSFSKIPDSEIDKLMKYSWPGNVRELENIIERGAILNQGPVFRVPELQNNDIDTGTKRSDITLRENERIHILKILEKTKWKVRGPGGAAHILELPPSTLAFRMKKLGIKRPK